MYKKNFVLTLSSILMYILNYDWLHIQKTPRNPHLINFPKFFCICQNRLQDNDYMLMLCGKEYVQSFKQGTSTGTGTGTIYFGKNLKAAKKKDNIFKMEELYLDMIDSSQKELTIVMAYFSPLKKFTDAILKACERGVKVKIVIPASANFQDDSNKQTVNQTVEESLQITDYKSIDNNSFLAFLEGFVV